MELTFVSRPSEIVSTIGANESIVISVSSDEDLGGKDIYVVLSQFITGKPPLVISTPPTEGYSFTYPASNATVILSKNLDPALHILNVQARIISQQRFDLTIDFLMKADREQSDTGSANNIDHFEKSTLLTAATYVNSRPTVYSRCDRILRTEIIVFDGATKEDQVNYDTPVQARFWCEELLDCGDCFPDGCVLGVVDNYGFDLLRGGMIVSNLSAYADTILRVSVNIGLGTIDSFAIAIYRRDNSDNSTNYWTDLSMGYSEYSPAQSGVYGIGTDPFPVSSSSFSLLSGTTHTVDLTLDKSYFRLGGEYRFFVVIKNSEGKYSCYSPIFLADDPPQPTFGSITAQTFDYSSNNNQYGDCILNAACGERLKLCVSMNEQEYNDNIFAFKTTGNFQNNFEALGIVALDRRPFEADDLDGSVDPLFDLTRTTTGGCVVFRIPDEWTGTTKYVVFVYVFRLEVNNFVYRDYIYKYFRIQTGNLSTSLTAILTDDQAVTVSDRICDSYAGDLTLTTTNALGPSYDHISLIKRGTGGWQEENDYTNNNLDQLDADALSIDPDFAGNDAQTVVTPTELSINQDYCIKVIAKAQIGTPSNPTPDTFDVIFTLEVTQSTTSPEGEIFVRYNLNWSTAYVGTFDQINIQVDDSTNIFLNHSNTTTSGSVSFENFINAAPSNTYNVTTYIRIPNGVEYTRMFTMTINSSLGSTDSETINFS